MTTRTIIFKEHDRHYTSADFRHIGARQILNLLIAKENKFGKVELVEELKAELERYEEEFGAQYQDVTLCEGDHEVIIQQVKKELAGFKPRTTTIYPDKANKPAKYGRKNNNVYGNEITNEVKQWEE